VCGAEVKEVMEMVGAAEHTPEIVRRITELWDSADWGSAALVAPSTVVRRLGQRGWDVRRHAEVPYYPACMIKVPLALATHVLIERGSLGLEQEVTVQAGQVTESAGPAEYRAGARPRVRELLFHAVIYSDNTAANVLLDLVGRERGTEIVRSLGLRNTALRRYLSGISIIPDPAATGRNEHDAADAAHALELILTGAVPDSHGLRMLLWRSYGPYEQLVGTRFGMKVYEKDGITSAVYHDGVGFEFPNATYVASLYTPIGSGGNAKDRVLDYWVRLAEILREDASS
jgi:beta-lactamase class A